MSKGEAKKQYKDLENRIEKLQHKMDTLQLSVNRIECSSTGEKSKDGDGKHEEYTYQKYIVDKKSRNDNKSTLNKCNMKERIYRVYNKWFGEKPFRKDIVLFAFIYALFCFIASFFVNKYMKSPNVGHFVMCLGVYMFIYTMIALCSRIKKIEAAIWIVAILWAVPYMLLKFIFEKVFRLKTLFKYIECMMVIIIPGMLISIIAYLYILWGVLIIFDKYVCDISIRNFIIQNVFTKFVIAFLAIMVMYYVPLSIFKAISKCALKKKMNTEYIKKNKAILATQQNAYLLVDQAFKSEISLYYLQGKFLFYVILVIILFCLQNNSKLSFIFDNSVMLMAFNFFIIIDAMCDKWDNVKE